MAVSSINNQASQTVAFVKSLSTSSSVSTTITSTDPTVLQNQINRLSSAITQLQSSGGSSQQIQEYQQAMQAAKNQIKIQQQLTEEQKPSSQASNKALTKGVNVKA